MRFFLKVVLDVPCFFLSLVPIFFIKAFKVKNRYADFSVFLGYVPFFIGERIRYYFYKHTLVKVGKNVRFKFGSWVQYPTVEIGDNVLIGYFNSLGECKIGNDVLLGGGVKLLSGLNQHNFNEKNVKIIDQGGQREKILIENDVYIGSGCIIGANVAEGCVIAAGSVVVDDTEKYGIYVSKKAKVINMRG
tara:strand:- start:1107 stop:1676 length:570 start_codon:yes stop_codon:yes gene_type:complete